MSEDPFEERLKLVMFIMIGIACGIALFTTRARGEDFNQAPHDHGFYSDTCCSGRDCAPIRAGGVSITNEGYVVEGSANISGHRWVIPFNDVRVIDGQDGRYHICLGIISQDYRNERGERVPGYILRCFYKPGFGT